MEALVASAEYWGETCNTEEEDAPIQVLLSVTDNKGAYERLAGILPLVESDRDFFRYMDLMERATNVLEVIPSIVYGNVPREDPFIQKVDKAAHQLEKEIANLLGPATTDRLEKLKQLYSEIPKLESLIHCNADIENPSIQLIKDKTIEKTVCPRRKKPSSPYALWFQDKYCPKKDEDEEKSKGPLTKAPFKELLNTWSSEWDSLAPDEKLVYEEKYKADREAYLGCLSEEKRKSEELKLLEDDKKQKSHLEQLKQLFHFAEGTTKSLEKQDAGKLAIFFYRNERREVLLTKQSTVDEFKKRVDEEWSEKTAAEKKPYGLMAKLYKEVFDFPPAAQKNLLNEKTVISIAPVSLERKKLNGGEESLDDKELEEFVSLVVN